MPLAPSFKLTLSRPATTSSPACHCTTTAACSPCREFQTPDEEMKKIVLKVVKQCVGTDGVEPDYIRTEVGGQRGC